MSCKCIDLHGMAVAYEAEISNESSHGMAGGCYRCFGPSMPGYWQRNPILAAGESAVFFFSGTSFLQFSAPGGGRTLQHHRSDGHSENGFMKNAMAILQFLGSS